MTNYLTEGEARIKWCPHRQYYQNQVDDCLCIASACMFWQRVKVPVPFNSQNRNSSGEPISTIEAGYCGAVNLPNSYP